MGCRDLCPVLGEYLTEEHIVRGGREGTREGGRGEGGGREGGGGGGREGGRGEGGRGGRRE